MSQTEEHELNSVASHSSSMDNSVHPLKEMPRPPKADDKLVSLMKLKI